MVRFSVIVATYNREHKLRQCLEAVSRLETPRSEFEVIVVDDGSLTPAEEVVRDLSGRLDVKLIWQQNGGPAKARNRGARIANGKLLAFLDDDCRPKPDWLEQLRSAFETWGECLLGGAVENSTEENLCSLASHLLSYQRYDRYAEDPRRTLRVAALNLAAPRTDFLTLGGFDERFTDAAYEDHDFCDRWAASGRVIRFAPDATVVHDHRMNLAEFWQQHARYGRGARRFYQGRGRSAASRLRRGLLADYAEVMRSVRNATTGLRRWALTALIAWSQVAAAFGYFTARATESKFADGRGSTNEGQSE